MSAAAVPDTRIDSYRRIQIYGTKSRLYVVGHDSGVCRILKFRRQDGPRLDAVVDPICYTPSQLSLVLRKVHEQSGGLQLICKVGLECCSRLVVHINTHVRPLVLAVVKYAYMLVTRPLGR